MILSNCDLSVWFQYIASTMLDPDTLIYTLIVALITFAVLFFGLGKFWGLPWNRKWDLNGSRFWLVAAISAVGAISMVGANCLDGGKNIIPGFEIASLMKEHEGAGPKEINEEAKELVPIIRKVQDLTATEEEKQRIAKEKLPAALESDPIIILLSSDIVSSYLSALTIIWTIFGICAGTLLLGVAWFAYHDIKETDPYAY